GGRGAESKSAEEIVGAVPAARLERGRIGPLHLASLHRMFELRLGRSFPRLVLVRVEEASRGNPLYALELGRALIRGGVPADPHDPLPVPDSLGSLIARRLSLLPARTRRAMLLTASAAEATLAELEAASPGFVDDLRPAIESDLVAIDRDAVRFGHPLFAQGVATLASPAELRAAHQDLAAATPSPDARARHLAQATDSPDASVATALADAPRAPARR